MSVFSMAGSNPALPTYPLQRSVRLRSSASAFFSRTESAVATSNQKLTFSAWIKRGSLTGNLGSIYQAGVDVSCDIIRFTNTDTLQVWFNAAASVAISTSAVFRDPSAWYHIVVAIDTTQATSTNRILIYVNGVAQTTTGTQPALNATFAQFNQNTIINRFGYYNSTYFDGYIAEAYVVDGQQLTASSFGAYNSYGVWSPAKYTGSYGTNGFYLNFQDNSALTTTANVGIGKDSSGNGNYWTSNNISVTSGYTYDSMLDVPTNTSASNANFALLNPINSALSGGALYWGNTYIICAVAGATSTSNATIRTTSGKYYFEVQAITNGGFGQAGLAIQTLVGTTTTLYAKYAGNGGDYATYGTYGVAYDVDAGKMWIRNTSGTWVSGDPVAGTSPTFTFTANSETYPVGISSRTTGNNAAGLAYYNFGQQPFSYTPPTGFVSLNTYNLPDSIVPVGAQYMAATTYTGNSSTNSLTNTVNGKSFQPDFVWIKNRTSALSHYLNDSVRGVYQTLFSNSTAAEYNGTSTSDGVSAFNTSGFTVLNGTNAANYNQSANNYVAWQWRASNASAVTNTAGSITSSVSANQTAGFSIVTYTGTGANATVGHGLGVAPRMIIAKSRGTAGTNWGVWHTSLTAYSYYLLLNSTAAQATAATTLQSLPSSTVVSVGSSSIFNDASTMVMYCFAAVPGYSAFGSYTGNGSTDGPFVYLGFRPRWILLKRTDTTGYDWQMYDTSQNQYNVSTATLAANSSGGNGSFTSGYDLDILSNGFKWRAIGVNVNASGGTYIYAVFAENPFKNSLAR